MFFAHFFLLSTHPHTHLHQHAPTRRDQDYPILSKRNTKQFMASKFLLCYSFLVQITLLDRWCVSFGFRRLRSFPFFLSSVSVFPFWFPNSKFCLLFSFMSSPINILIRFCPLIFLHVFKCTILIDASLICFNVNLLVKVAILLSVFSALLISTLMSQCRNFSYVFR